MAEKLTIRRNHYPINQSINQSINQRPLSRVFFLSLVLNVIDPLEMLFGIVEVIFLKFILFFFFKKKNQKKKIKNLFYTKF